MLKNKKDFKVVSPRIGSPGGIKEPQGSPGLSKPEIDKLFKLYSSMDGKHKKFKGSKEEYVLTVGGMVKNFLANISPPDDKQGSGKDSEYKKVLTPLMQLYVHPSPIKGFKKSTYGDWSNLILNKYFPLLKVFIPSINTERDDVMSFENQIIENTTKEAERYKNLIEKKKALPVGKLLSAPREKFIESYERIKAQEAAYNTIKASFKKKSEQDKIPTFDVMRGALSELTNAKYLSGIKKSKIMESMGKIFNKAEFEPVSKTNAAGVTTTDNPEWFTIPKTKHDKTTGIYSTDERYEVFKPFGRLENVTYAELERYARLYYKIMHRFIGDVTATTNFLLAVKFTDLTSLNAEGEKERIKFAHLLTSRSRSQLTGGEWTPANEASYRTEYACYKLLIKEMGLDKKNEELDETEMRYMLLGKIFSAEIGNAVIDFPTKNFVIESKGKKLLGSASDNKHPGMQVDVKKIAQLIYESFRSSDWKPNKQANCWFIQYAEDIPMSKFTFLPNGAKAADFASPIEAIISFDITKMLTDRSPSIKFFKEQLKPYVERYKNSTTSKERGKVSKDMGGQKLIFDMIQSYFSQGSSKLLPQTAIGGPKKGNKGEYTLSLDISEPLVSEKLELLAYSKELFKIDKDDTPAEPPTVEDYAKIWTTVSPSSDPDLTIENVEVFVKDTLERLPGESTKRYQRRVDNLVDDLTKGIPELRVKLKEYFENDQPYNKATYGNKKLYDSNIKDQIDQQLVEIRAQKQLLNDMFRKTEEKILSNRAIIKHRIRFAEQGDSQLPTVIESNAPKINREVIEFKKLNHGDQLKIFYKKKKELLTEMSVKQLQAFLKATGAAVSGKKRDQLLYMFEKYIKKGDVISEDTSLDPTDFAITKDPVTKTFVIQGPFSQESGVYNPDDQRFNEEVEESEDDDDDDDDATRLPAVGGPGAGTVSGSTPITTGTLVLPPIPPGKKSAKPPAAGTSAGGKDDFDNIKKGKPKSYHKKVIKYY